MRSVILSMMVTLDGMIARADGDLNWFQSDEGFEVEMLSVLRGVDAMVFGRVSYELLAAYWPTAGESAEQAPGGLSSQARAREFAALMNSIPKLVLSRTLARASWGPSTLIRGDVAAEVAKLKAQPGKDIVVFAGAGAAATFMNLDLIDEYRLMIHPIALGRGISLFRELEQERPLRLKRTETFGCGVVLVQYERARSA